MAHEARWDGRAIIGTLLIDGVQTEIVADRDTVHKHAPGYSDALTWELARFAEEILEKLKPHFEALGKR